MSSTQPILNIAHRGASSLAPENTLAAAAKALNVGANMWELDVGVTLDGKLIVIHDDSLARTSNAAQLFPYRSPWQVYAFTLNEIRQLDFGSWFVETDPFAQIQQNALDFDEVESYRRQKAPTLQEALDFTRAHNWRVNVEIKDMHDNPGNRAVVERVVGVIQDLKMTRQVLLSSFNHHYLTRVHAVDTQIETGVLVAQPVADPVALLKRYHAQAYHPHRSVVSVEQISQLRQAGYGVNVWTVNEPEQMRHFIEAGVTGIVTDFPQTLHPILHQSETIQS